MVWLPSNLYCSEETPLKPSEIFQTRSSYERRHLHLDIIQQCLHNISCVKEDSGCGQIRVFLQVMESPSTTHEISSSAASTREFMKHASIDPCTRLPKNSNYTELMHFFIVYIYVLLLTVILVNILSYSYIQTYMMFLKTCHIQLLHYIAQYCHREQLTRVSFLE